MGRNEAEGVFAQLLLNSTGTQLSQSVGKRARELRDVMMRLRVTQDSGFDPGASQTSRRRQVQHRNAQAALKCGDGAAVGMATQAQLLLGNPLPACDRWGDTVAASLGGPISLNKSDVLGHEGRPTLPSSCCATEAVGPHGNMKALFHTSTLPIVSYEDIRAKLNQQVYGGATMEETTAVLASVVIVPDGASERDDAARQADGSRVWPPRAVRSDDTAKDVEAMIRAMIADVSPRKQKKSGPPRPGSTAGVELYRRACQTQLDRGEDELASPVRRAFVELGICVLERNPLHLPLARRRALHASMSAHAAGLNGLGGALSELSDVVGMCEY